MLGHLTVCAVECWVVEIGVNYPRLEVIDDDGLGDTAKELEHAEMAFHEALLILREDKLNELVAAEGECTDEGVDSPATL